MKPFRNIKRYHFLIAVTASTLFLSLLGFAGKNSVYADYSVDLLKVPQLAVVFEGIKDRNYPWYVLGGKQIKASGGDTQHTPDSGKPGDTAESTNGKEDDYSTIVDNSNIDSGNGKVPGKVNNNGSAGQYTHDKGPDKGSSDTASGSAIEPEVNKGSNKPPVPDKDGEIGKNGNTGSSDTTDSNNTGNGNNIGKDSNTGNGTTTDKDKDITNNQSGNTDKNTDKDSNTGKDSTSATEDDFKYETVEKSYFNDALFIGDSRTVGLSEYSGWTEPTYFANVGLTIYDIFDKEIAEVNGKKLTVEKALAKKKYGKIYIMLGINELGTGTTKTFAAEYKKVIEKIQQLQPDAIIYIEGIMNVTKKKSDSDKIFNNKNIKDRNKGIAALADNKTTFYLDVNEVITDKSGGIPEKYTFDSIHLKAAYYKIWTEFLLNHGIVK